MPISPDPSRRTLLQALAVFGGMGLLSGCRTAVKPITPAIPAPTPAPFIMPAITPLLRVVAPSGLLPQALRAEHGVQRLSQAGYRLDNIGCLSRQYQRFAGTDAERIADFNGISNAAPPKIILSARGGYGAMRILPYIDWKRLCPLFKEAGTLVMGYSDFTAIQLALLTQGGVSSFAGPMLYSDFGAPVPSIDTMNAFVRASTQQPLSIRVSQAPAHHLKAEGLFWGGNLTVLAHLLATPYFPEIDGGILFLEDVGEQPYRIERMLQQLHLAGVLKRQRAIVLGDFSLENTRDHYDPGYTLETVAQHVRKVTGVPVFTGFPFGHIRNKATFPLGAMATLATDTWGYSVSFPEYPTSSALGLDFSTLSTVL
ncbi:LD-carboxypeptidase [Craterilacuibacter sp.]|uniref:LD-carboxypeptidase n=1 Tax=Craterilacuibacter sp. TaxID=2870909 RepID=UPI003F2EDF09